MENEQSDVIANPAPTEAAEPMYREHNPAPVFETDFLPGKKFTDVRQLQEAVTIEMLTTALVPVIGSAREFADLKGLKRAAGVSAVQIYTLMQEGLILPSGMMQLNAMKDYGRDNADSLLPFKGRAIREPVKLGEEQKTLEGVGDTSSEDTPKAPAEKPKAAGKKKAASKKKAATK